MMSKLEVGGEIAAPRAAPTVHAARDAKTMIRQLFKSLASPRRDVVDHHARFAVGTRERVDLIGVVGRNKAPVTHIDERLVRAVANAWFTHEPSVLVHELSRKAPIHQMAAVE